MYKIAGTGDDGESSGKRQCMQLWASRCLPSVGSRTLREAAVCCQSVPGSSGKPLSAVSPFPEVPGSHCLLSVRSRKFREATVCCQSVPGSSG
ncbi:MAG: hypothetical protein LBL07_13745, partial [Tannerella sp.]|nr:hypothetical protein [Tannerella sp.]